MGTKFAAELANTFAEGEAAAYTNEHTQKQYERALEQIRKRGPEAWAM